MLEPLEIHKSKLIPEVILDKQKNIFKISGKSITVNTAEFYSQIILWFEKYLTNPNKCTKLELQLEYLNSSSSIQINRLMSLLEKNEDAEKEIKIIWLYENDDELIYEIGKELQNSTKLDFKLQEIELSN
ncbi:MAG: DUF1987 domain-containing protein [Bacteroidales bacterium]|nr:DUF1987 domain-containing protein [Bacteroidales bacterium]